MIMRPAAAVESGRGAFTSFIHLWHVLIYLRFVSVLPFAFLFVKGKQTENRSVCVISDHSGQVPAEIAA